MKQFTGILLVTIFVVLYGCKKENGNAPVITLLGKNPAKSGVGYPYVDAGATAMDNEDGDLTSKIVITDNVNTSTPGNYTVKYNVSDKDGNQAPEITREVTIAYYK